MRQFATESHDESGPITITVDEVISETKLAICVQYDGRSIWLPKSRITVNRRLEGPEIDIDVPRWLAEAKGLA
jgi:hypothetical protein